jgi:ATP/maltotriose-dependent transcriptional regulator MalT
MPGTDILKLNEAIDQAATLFNRLVLLAAPGASGKTLLLHEVCEQRSCPLINVNLRLSQKLLELPRTKRPARIDRLFGELIEACDGDLIVLDDLEVLFDPVLQVDPLRLLKGHSRNKTLIASWNGTFQDGTLSYAEPDHPEYKSYRNVVIPVVSVSKQTTASN